MDDHQLARLASELSQDDEAQQTSSPVEQSGSKRKADDGPQQRAKRNRYISIACNECKRRKIKCNGQTPCQRCGNLSLLCVYTPNCCNVRDSVEYRDLAAQVSALQSQVNALFSELSSVCAQLGRNAPDQQRHAPQPPPAQQRPSHAQHVAIDPSLQSPYSTQPSLYDGSQLPSASSLPPLSPSRARQPRVSPDDQPRFRGPTSNAYNFGVAKSSLKTMGITSPAEDQADGGSGTSREPTREGSPIASALADRDAQQLAGGAQANKDPLHSLPLDEVLRLCRVYEDEVGLMYPIVDIDRVTDHATRLYRFLDAARRQGLVQNGGSGMDGMEDEDIHLLKLVLAVAMTVEASGRSDLGRRMFDTVQPAIDAMLLGPVGIKGIRLLTVAAMYEFQSDNEGTSWRIIGLTVRMCIERGLHRRETYDAIEDELERTDLMLVFWSIYVLDRRWSFGTGMPFALQDSDIDPLLPKPSGQSQYLDAMIQYCGIASKVWKTAGAYTSLAQGVAAVDVEEMGYLDYQILRWLSNVPEQLRYEHPLHAGSGSRPSNTQVSRGTQRLQITLYLRTNQMRILIYRAILHSATNTMQHSEQAQKVVGVAKDTIRVLTHLNQTSDLYRTQQVLFNAFLTSALAVLFLAASHAPAVFADAVREEFYLALELVRAFSRHSWVSKRLWKTIRGLKEVAPQIGLTARDDLAGSERAHRPDEPMDASRSAAVAMAGLAGHNVDEMTLYGGGGGGAQAWQQGGGASCSPSGMVNDLSTLFEAAGGYAAMGSGTVAGAPVYSGRHHGGGTDEGLSEALRDLF